MGKVGKSLIRKDESGSFQRISDYVGSGAFRFADRDEEGAQSLRRFPKEDSERRFHHVSVFHIHAPLRKS